MNTTLNFPNGMAVQKVMDQKALKEGIPPHVKKMMEKKDCMDLYIALTDILYESGVGINDEDDQEVWNEGQMKQTTKVLSPKFEAKGGELCDWVFQE